MAESGQAVDHDSDERMVGLVVNGPVEKLRVKTFVLTDGTNDYYYHPEFDMSPKQADKIIALMHAWKNAHGHD